MTDTRELLRQGVLAIKEQRDLATGRKLLSQVVQQDPDNELAWLWLARTMSDPAKRLQCIERVLAINPNNKTALALYEKLSPGQAPPGAEETPSAAPHQAEETDRLKTTADRLTAAEQQAVRQHLDEAATALDADDVEGAISAWVQALHIQADHSQALPSAVRYLTQLKYYGDAEELVWRAIEAGSPVESLPVLAWNLSKRSGDHGHVENVEMRLARTPAVATDFLLELSETYLANRGPALTFELVKAAVDSHPQDQALLMRLAALYEMAGDEDAALVVYQRVVEIDHRSPEGKEADRKVLTQTPELSSEQRGSVLLAVRETAGIGALFLLLAFQDAGLSPSLGLARLLGVVLSLIGGYLLVTGTSSPQQQPVASWLGGQPPADDPHGLPRLDETTRLVLSVAGGVLLVAALWLSFQQAFDLLFDPVAPQGIPTPEEIINEEFALGKGLFRLW